MLGRGKAPQPAGPSSRILSHPLLTVSPFAPLFTHLPRRGVLRSSLSASNIRATAPSCSRPRCYAFWMRPGRLQMGEPINTGDFEIWTEQVGEGPDVLLIGGAGDTVESWQFQLDGLADRYRLTAFDNRGAGRTAMPEVRSPSRRWPATPPPCCGRSASRPPTWRASPAAASSPRSWRSATPRWFAASRAEHVAGAGPLPTRLDAIRSLAARGRAERARVPRGLLARHLHGARTQRRQRRRDRRRAARVSA